MDLNSKHQWLVFYRIDEMSLQGGGVINGRGEKFPASLTGDLTLPGPCDSPVVREDPIFRREGPDIHVVAILSITRVFTIQFSLFDVLATLGNT
ncbi:polygalacturonase At1g48100-like [Daucus carota subsp. sativus]|uniref:polygalacturonase At1g48100-like n=1 Tax=Daucus carota subsp. sativus TaxID=79200 RepID=UPI00308383C0